MVSKIVKLNLQFIEKYKFPASLEKILELLRKRKLNFLDQIIIPNYLRYDNTFKKNTQENNQALFLRPFFSNSIILENEKFDKLHLKSVLSEFNIQTNFDNLFEVYFLNILEEHNHSYEVYLGDLCRKLSHEINCKGKLYLLNEQQRAIVIEKLDIKIFADKLTEDDFGLFEDKNLNKYDISSLEITVSSQECLRTESLMKILIEFIESKKDMLEDLSLNFSNFGGFGDQDLIQLAKNILNWNNLRTLKLNFGNLAIQKEIGEIFFELLMTADQNLKILETIFSKDIFSFEEQENLKRNFKIFKNISLTIPAY